MSTQCVGFGLPAFVQFGNVAKAPTVRPVLAWVPVLEPVGVPNGSEYGSASAVHCAYSVAVAEVE